MDLVLTEFAKSDIKLLDEWCQNIQSEQYMSNVTPEQYKRWHDTKNELLSWFLIKLNNQPVGTIWIEKRELSAKDAKLGILLGSQELFGKGIGTKSILHAIKLAGKRLDFKKVQLNVRISNTRAISCYRKCGFSIIGKRTKYNKTNKKIDFYTMELDV